MAVRGTWGIGNFRLPDFGLTEKIAPPSSKTFYNPAVPQSQGLSSYAFPSGFRSGSAGSSTAGGGGGGGSISSGQVQGASTSTSQDPNAWRKQQNTAQGYFNANGDWVGVGNDTGTGGPSQAELEAQLTEQINASYDPAYKNLDAVEAQYRSEYPTSQEFINQSYGEVTPQIEAEKQTKLGGLKTQRGEAKRQEKSQFESARQRFNELRQSVLTRFGGASSTGQAGQELLGRETAKEMGGIEQNFGDIYRGITEEESNVNNFYTQKLASLEKEKQLKLQELKNTFDTEIRRINTQRGALDSEKAARRLAALQEYSAQARQMQFEQQKFQQQLETWRAAKDEALTLAKQFNAKSFTIPGMPGLLNSFNITPGSYGVTPKTQTNKGIYNPLTYGGDTDNLDLSQMTDEELAKYFSNQ